jgi:hypothetical protein
MFRTGRRHDDLHTALAPEQIVVLEQHLKATITLRSFRSPHRRFGVRKQFTRATLAITRRRLLVWAEGMRQVDVTYDSPLFDALEISTEPERLLIAFDVARFHDDWTGRMEVRLRHAEPERLVAAIKNSRVLGG